MKITFLGTRGYIDVTTTQHKRHTTTLISYRTTRILLDWGQDWLKKPFPAHIDAIFVTHAHPDHASGLVNGAPCEVYATQESWQTMHNYAIKKRHTIICRKPIKIKNITLEAFGVVHSLRAPAVGYRITAGKVTIFYVPDLITIEQRAQALKRIHLYIGDGATIDRPLVRRSPEGKLFGHTTIRAQLGWCEKEGVPRAIFTHCGSQIVGGNTKKITAKITRYAREHAIITQIAHDGMEVVLR